MAMFFHLAERRIEEAVRAGVLDDLPGRGRPLAVEPMADVPEDLRAGYSILKAAGCVPEELDRRRAMLRLEDLLAACRDDDRSELLRRELAALRLAEAVARMREGR